jgi:hypothetical protein
VYTVDSNAQTYRTDHSQSIPATKHGIDSIHFWSVLVNIPDWSCSSLPRLRAGPCPRGKGNVILFPATDQAGHGRDGHVRCRERLGGLLKHYHREAA